MAKPQRFTPMAKGMVSIGSDYQLEQRTNSLWAKPIKLKLEPEVAPEPEVTIPPPSSFGKRKLAPVGIGNLIDPATRVRRDEIIAGERYFRAVTSNGQSHTFDAPGAALENGALRGTHQRAAHAVDLADIAIANVERRDAQLMDPLFLVIVSAASALTGDATYMVFHTIQSL